MRRRRPERRKILPDPVYRDLSISKFINFLMKGGKKGVAERIFYNALDKIKQKTKSDGVKIFEKAIEKAGAAGGEILYGGSSIEGSGNYVNPTIIKAENEWEIVQEETFSDRKSTRLTPVTH